MEDTEDLEALFDSIVQASKEDEPTAKEAPTVSKEAAEAPRQAMPGSSESSDPEVFSKLGHMTRSLFDALHELGYDKSLEKVAVSIPDANDRLAYIANLTQQAAERVLSATEVARPIQEKLGDQAEALSGQWAKVFDNSLSVDEFKELVHKTRNYLNDVPGQVRATNNQLTEIMMAQDFQDLTGQVIKKVVDIVRSVESQLIGLLIENMPKKEDVPEG
ncbi:MAG TPA: protein phosphatase CheZ, partial [Burkholderiales bacterium]|nr:protein phosphatase CheZ [Burkholderiales bacterium]